MTSNGKELQVIPVPFVVPILFIYITDCATIVLASNLVTIERIPLNIPF